VRLITLRLARLVDDLVTVQLVEDGRRVYQKEPIDLPALVGESVAAQQFEARRKQIEVRIAAPAGAVPRLLSDAVALRQVIDNLLSNALKYSPAGTQVWVEMGLSPGSGCQVSVRDQGPGLSVTDMGQIFQRYGRGQARPTGGENSLGLGLWIAQRIVSDLGGTLRCESVQGQGATFIVALPGA
jgi:signal transduction histidine kinase